jgi:hypothetical protein
MKHLKKFENFYLSPDVDSDEQDYLDYAKKMREVKPEEEITNPPHPHEEEEEFELSPMTHEEEEEESEMRPMKYEKEEEEGRNHIMSFEAKKSKPVSYKKSGLKKPELADRNKNKKIEGWEKAIAKKIEKSIEKKNK